MECKDIFRMGMSGLGAELDDPVIERLCLYFAELCKWNRKMNLVAKAPDREIIETHFLDSLTLLPLLETYFPPLRLLDIGTGAGFPGLVLKIALPDLEVTLVEPRAKRVSFLKHIIRTLDLKGVRALQTRVEKNSNTLAGEQLHFEIVTSRAFRGIAEFLDLASPLSPVGGKVICMKGPKAQEEIKEWEGVKRKSPYMLSTITTCTLPFSKACRNIVVFTKKDTLTR